MKTYKLLLMLLFGIFIYSCQPLQDNPVVVDDQNLMTFDSTSDILTLPPPTYTIGNPLVMDLYMDVQNKYDPTSGIKVGIVTIWNDQYGIYSEFSLLQEFINQGYYLSEAHIWAWKSRTVYETESWGPGTTEGTLFIDFDDCNNWYCDKYVDLAVHAVVCKGGFLGDDPEPKLCDAGVDCSVYNNGVITNTLWAGQNINAGSVQAWIENGNLKVKYSGANGWSMSKCDLGVSKTDLDEILKGKNNPSPGQFDYHYEPGNNFNEYTFSIPLENIEGATCGDRINIAAHADMHGPNNQGETGWACGDQLGKSGWSQYFWVEICCEEGGQLGSGNEVCYDAFAYSGKILWGLKEFKKYPWIWYFKDFYIQCVN